MNDTTRSVADPETKLPAQLGHYELGEKIGQGGMAVVYRGMQSSLNRAVAIKVLPPQFATTPELLARFEREAAIVAKLNHSNIVQIIDRGRDGAVLYIVMEYVEGQNLETIIRTGKLSLPQMIDIACQICDGLAYAHSMGVIHRDLKPANILIDQRTGRAKIADFGIAALESTEVGLMTLTMDHSVIGTMNYMSPEQRRDSHGVTNQTDIFSFGVIFYEMLTGKLPVGHFKLPSMIRPDMPLGLDNIVKRCLAESAADRYADAGQIRDELQRMTTRRTAPLSFSPMGFLNKRQRGLALAGTGALALLLLAGSLLLAHHFRGQKPAVAESDVGSATGSGVGAATEPVVHSAADLKMQADYVRAQDLMTHEQWAKAITAFQDLIEQNPKSPSAAEAQFAVATAFEQLQDDARSIEEYARLVRVYPESPRVPDAIVKKCRLEFEAGRQQHIFSGSTWTITLQNRLIAELQSLLERKLSTPQAAAALLLLHEIMEKPNLSHTREAADVLITLYELDPVGQSDALYRAAELYDKSGGTRARETYMRFIKDFPDDPRTTKAQERLTHLQPKENP